MQILVVSVILLLFGSEILGQYSDVNTYSCSKPNLKNGNVTLASNGRYVGLQCSRGFKLFGPWFIFCVGGRWQFKNSICMAPGCIKFKPTSNGRIDYLERGIHARITCKRRFELIGNDETFCDGTDWDRNIGSCREINIKSPLFCDFEGELKCNWKNYFGNKINWMRTNMGDLGIGPQHDHTQNKKYEGFFMLLEGGSPNNTISYFLSPVYNSEVSNNSCFKFYYHMYGLITGAIRVFVKMEIFSFSTSLRNYTLLEITNRSANAWIEALIPLPKLKENFQIVIQGEIMQNQLTDIAIDDVEILDGTACEADKAVVTEKPEDETDGVFDVQSCQSRCDDTSPASHTTTSTLKCDCYDGCVDEDTCCPDYEQFCIFDKTTMDPYGYSTEIITEKPLIRKLFYSTSRPTSTIGIQWNTTTTTTTRTTTTRRPRFTTPISTISNNTKMYKIPMYESIPTTPNYIKNRSRSVDISFENVDHKIENQSNRIQEDTGGATWMIVTGIIISIMIIGTLASLYVYRERRTGSFAIEFKKDYYCKPTTEELSEIDI